MQAIVEIDIGHIIGADVEEFLDLISERMTGGLGLVDCFYRPVQILEPTQGTIALELKGRIDWDLMDEDDSGEEVAS